MDKPHTPTPPSPDAKVVARRGVLRGLLAAPLLATTLASTPFLAGQALGQTRTGRLPPWVQWNRVQGRAWQTRTVTTVRAYPSQGLLTVFKWRQGPTSPIHLRTYTGLEVEIEKLFRIYEARPAEDLVENPEEIEDFGWVLGNRLRENIWTSFSEAAADTWKGVFEREDFEETPIPSGSDFYVLVQPTMDKMPDPEAQDPKNPQATIDFTGENAQTPLARIVDTMMAQNMMVAQVPARSIPELPADVVSGRATLMARITPRPELAVGVVYIRFVRQEP
jgi:hypothetical protein